MKQYKRYILTGLVSMITILAVVVFASGIARPEVKQSDKVHSDGIPHTTTPKSGTSTQHNDNPIPSDTPRVGEGRSIQYLSAQQEGVIGAYAGKQLDNPADNIFTVKLDKVLSTEDKVWLSYDLTGVADYTSIPHSINDRLATGGYLVKTTNSTGRQRERIHPAWLKQGENFVQFSLPENAGFGYKVSNLVIEIESLANTSALVVNASSASYNNKAYISGFVQGKNTSDATFFVDGKQVKNIHGIFETIVAVNDKRSVEVKAIYANGKEEKKEILFAQGENLSIEFAMNRNIHQSSKTFTKGVADDLKLEAALLKVESSALLVATKQISITTLRDIDLPALNMGMSNVTDGSKGYRFLPHGEHFAKGASVAIKYDRTKIPNGFTEDDIKTFYFDLDSKNWIALEKDSIDKKNQLIVSRTTHFTDMINGVIQTPESPETQGFAPTMMNDIKAADPTAKVQVIAAPSANNRGSAGTSYSFEMPPARNGMSPSMGIQYNSDGGSGWLGEGWDLSSPSISVDTRWGVPRYNDAEETETYSFSGSMLVTIDDKGESSVAHRGDRIARKADRQFYPRNEGSFSKIIRKGNTPGNYTWEVTDKSGTRYTYGGNGAVLKGIAKTLNGDKEVVVEWKLSRVEELHGDYIEYVYDAVDELVRGNLTAKAIYLKEVHAGNKGENPHTIVTLTSATQKDKKNNSARYGFLTSSNKLLNKVNIAFEGETLRSYTFEYKNGAFNTNVLAKINHIDSKGELFASHDMDYYDDVKSTEGYVPFKKEEEWNLPKNNINAGFINPLANLGINGFSDEVTAIGGTKATSSTYSGYVGVGPTGQNSKKWTAGISFSHNKTTAKGVATLVDINGDGLPDKVYQKNDKLYYSANISKIADDTPEFGEEIEINSNLKNFSKTVSRSNTWGGKGHAGFGNITAILGADYMHFNNEASIYFTDVNNDQLIDIIADGQVYFNHIEYKNGKAIPTFTLSSGNTPSPMVGGGIIDSSDTEVNPQEQADMIANNPLQDVVRVWEAPFSGTIKIDGEVQLISPTGNYDKDEYAEADGVRVAIQVGAKEEWYKSILKGDAKIYPAAVNNIPVQKGQRVYFRLQSGNKAMSNGAFDKVAWSPTISFIDRANLINPNGQGTAIYKASESDFISMNTQNQIAPASTVKVSGTFVKPITSDSVTLKVILSNNMALDDEKGTLNPDYERKVVFQKTFTGEDTYNGNLSFDITNDIPGENLQFMIESQTNVAFEKIKWNPAFEYAEDGAIYKSKAVVYYSTFDSHLYEGHPYSLTQDAFLKIEPHFTYKNKPVLPDTNINGKILMAVKSNTGILVKKEVNIVKGIVTPTISIDSLQAKTGNIWIEYYNTDPELLDKIIADSVSVTSYKDSYKHTQKLSANTFTKRVNNGFGEMYRGWGQFVYNSAEERFALPINESLLKLPEDSASADPRKMVLSMMVPDTIVNHWIGQTSDIYIDGKYMNSARLGEQDVVLTNPLANLNNSENTSGSCIQGGGTIAIGLKTRGDSFSGMASAGFDLPGISGSGTLSDAKGWQDVETAYMDMNGDGYPDIITKNQIQFTSSVGRFDNEILGGSFKSHSTSENISVARGAEAQHAYKISNDNTGRINQMLKSIKATEASTSISGSGSFNHNSDNTESSFADINGDGLPDRIITSNQKRLVQLNLGYGFTEPFDYGLSEIDTNSGYSIGLSADAGAGIEFGFDKAAGSFSGGFNVATVYGQKEYALMDINADGLPDKVWKSDNKIYVQLNTGDGFTDTHLWNGVNDINKSASTSESLRVAFTVSIPIGILPIRIAINPAYATSATMNRTLADIRDVDGDGYPDLISSDKENKMLVHRSTFGRTNKLKSVQNPLGGAFTIDYTRSEATYDHPGGKWVMNSVEVNDGINDDGANMKTVFEYADGRHERHEREFLGFGKVITKNIDTEATDADKVYRKAIQEYDVRNVYTAGNQLRAVVESATGNKYSENVNEYYTYKVKASADNYTFTADNNICSDRAIAFTPMKYTKSVVYEGQAEGMTANESYYDYYLNGNFGELKSYIYSDKGTLGSNGTGAYNYQTQVDYTHNKTKHIFGLPVKVQVKGADGQLYRQVEATYDLNYANHLTKVTQLLNTQGAKAEIDITYDKSGNITQKTMPANSKGQRMWYKYKYDRDYNMYVERVEDAFGYRSELEDYDYRFGVPLVSRDMNGYTLETTIDHMGRVSTITGPNEQVLGLPYTIKFEYHPQIVKDDKGIKSPAYAVTKHYDPSNPNDDIETVTFVDGVGRAVQVKKDGVITTTDAQGRNPQDKKVMIVSGRAKFDAFGRAVAAYHPVDEAIGSKTVFNRTFDAIVPSLTAYDIMDRAVTTTLPDGSVSKMEYAKDNSSRTLVTTVTDAMGGKQSTFANTSGLTMKTEQYSGPDGTITTSFAYDAINQLLKAIDHDGNETLSSYDMVGRRTEVRHPASGTNKFVFDNAGNLLSKETANLGKEGKVISYDYDFNRLMAITYPDHPENNVKYYYGNKNASHNRVGRLMLQEDATGAQEFYYGRLGELNKVRRTVIIPNQAIATYVTEWKYDSWNRLTEMIYPDLEKISYSYNTGGLLESVKGEKSYSYNYVNKIGYDKFEQRTYLKYCNGSETSYSYDPQRRRLDNLKVWSKQQIIDNKYSYDKVDNVLSVMNAAPVNTGLGGQMQHNYSYDGLYRLQSATGTYAGSNGKTAQYDLAMGYDNMHRITSKKQHMQQKGVQFDGLLKAGYDLTYAYDGATPFQLSNLKDDSYRTEGADVEDKLKKDHKYEYDANGNLMYVSIERLRQDTTQTAKNNERKLWWDEENRLRSVSDNGFISNYTYDASGERVVKMSGGNETMYVNSAFSGGNTETANFTAYVNPYLVVSKGGQYTKHIYIGSQRIVSKLGDLDSYGQDPRRIEYAGANVDGAKVDYKTKYEQSQEVIKDAYALFEVDYNGKDNNDYVNGSGFCCDNKVLKAGAMGNGNDNPELFQYYYHPDHLGSTSYITNLDGDVVQHIEYVPFGEVFLEERNNKWNTPYLFNAKELDEETGLYYYGARYYDPRSSVWLSVDPLAEKKYWSSPYTYCLNNPLRFIDPDGRDEFELDENGNYSRRILNEEKTGFYIVNKDGGRIDGKSLEFEYTNITHSVGTVSINDEEGNIKEQRYDAFTMSGDKNSTKVFEFLAQTTGVSKDFGGTASNAIEWAHLKFGKEGSTSLNTVTTSHLPKSEISGNEIHSKNSGVSLREWDHNHPYMSISNAYLTPSGIPGTTNAESGDIPHAKWIMEKNPSIRPIKFSVYSGYIKKYVQYNNKNIINK